MKVKPETALGQSHQTTDADCINTATCCGETLQGDPEPAAERGARRFRDAMGTLGEAIGARMILEGEFGNAPFATTITLTWDLSARLYRPTLAELFQHLHARGKYAPQF